MILINNITVTYFKREITLDFFYNLNYSKKIKLDFFDEISEENILKKISNNIDELFKNELLNSNKDFFSNGVEVNIYDIYKDLENNILTKNIYCVFHNKEFLVKKINKIRLIYLFKEGVDH